MGIVNNKVLFLELSRRTTPFLWSDSIEPEINGVNSVTNGEDVYVKLREIAILARDKKTLNMDVMNYIIVELCRINPLSG